MVQLALEGFAAFFVTVTPLNAAPLFVALTAGLERILGKTGMSTVTRVFGILLMALAAEFILGGLRGSGIFR
jgi:small neutral amino acid transporter SnatA (MarC family)